METATAEYMRKIIQGCFNTLYDDAIVIIPNSSLPIPTEEEMQKVLQAIQDGYDKEYNRPITPRVQVRLTVDMLRPEVQVALVQSLINLIRHPEIALEKR